MYGRRERDSERERRLDDEFNDLLARGLTPRQARRALEKAGPTLTPLPEDGFETEEEAEEWRASQRRGGGWEASDGVLSWRQSTHPDDWRIQVTTRGHGRFQEISVRSKGGPSGKWERMVKAPSVEWARDYLDGQGVDADQVRVSTRAL